ncbi:MAG: hypothetical protein R3D05_15545 [Dongiaceae bacterium]
MEILRTWGPVHAGSSSGDFTVAPSEEHPGWLVLCHHPDIITYVDPAEMGMDPPSSSDIPLLSWARRMGRRFLAGGTSTDLAVGLVGRGKRGKDARTLQIIHVHDAT